MLQPATDGLDLLGANLANVYQELKNLGSDQGGAITAGKFLAHFTERPFIHLDIAGTAFLTKRDAYRTKGGTGVGVRLFTEFMQRMAAERTEG